MQSTCSSSSEAPPSPTPSDTGTQGQLSSTPQPFTLIADLPESDESSSSHSLPPADSSLSPDSKTVSTTLVTGLSSTASQQEPVMMTSPAEGTENEPEVPPASSAVNTHTAGFKMVIDNIDKTVKRRDQTIDAQTTSLHYVQVYSVKDRVDYSNLSTSRPSPCESLYTIIPTSSDYQTLKDNFSLLVARVLVEYIPYFSGDFKGLAARHILHEYSQEMANKSDVVGRNNRKYPYTAIGLTCPPE